MTTRPHYKLDAWKEAMALVTEVYQRSSLFPREEIYGLTSQIRRSAVSIPSNMAEGAARLGSREFVRFLNIAKGSLSELETQLLIAVSLKYLQSDDSIFNKLDRVSRLITGLQQNLLRTIEHNRI
jgi:four helix bundle protein